MQTKQATAENYYRMIYRTVLTTSCAIVCAYSLFSASCTQIVSYSNDTTPRSTHIHTSPAYSSAIKLNEDVWLWEERTHPATGPKIGKKQTHCHSRDRLSLDLFARSVDGRVAKKLSKCCTCTLRYHHKRPERARRTDSCKCATYHQLSLPQSK